MKTRVAAKRTRGMRRPVRGLSISATLWDKVKCLSLKTTYFSNLKAESLLSETEKAAAHALHTGHTYPVAEILRAAIEQFLGDNREIAHRVGEAFFAFLDKPLLMPLSNKWLPQRRMGIRSPIADIPKEMPVLIDDSILLLAILRTEKQQAVEAVSSMCYGLIRSSAKRRVFLHQFHQDQFLTNLANHLRARFPAGTVPDGDREVPLGDFLAAKACQLAALELNFLRVDYSDVTAAGCTEHFVEKMAVAAVKRHLGHNRFVFASALFDEPVIEDIKVFGPGDIPLGAK